MAMSSRGHRAILLIWTLHLPEPTRILKQPEYKVVQRGMSASFECKVKHDPSLIPVMIWLKDNGDLPDDDRYKVPENHRRLISLILTLVIQIMKKKTVI